MMNRKNREASNKTIKNADFFISDLLCGITPQRAVIKIHIPVIAGSPREKEEKIPWYVKVKNRNIFAMAGVYDIWKDAEGKEFFTYSIITTTPNNFMANIHNRMPVILKKEDEDKYLIKETPLAEILKLLKPFPGTEMEGWPVSTKVNSPANDDIKLTKPL